MDIEFKNADRILFVKLKGELDHHTSAEVRQKIERESGLSNYIDIIFDFSELSFMDSSGIGMIMGRYKNVEAQGGGVAIVSAGADIRRIIEISGLHKIINCYNNVNAAKNALKTMDRRG